MSAQRQRRLAALYRGHGLPRVRGTAPRVAVVGAGLAGLTAAHLLAQAGCAPALFEADDRVGGRIWSMTASSGQVWELGAELIDSAHDDMHALCACFGLDLLDTMAPGEERLRPAYHFGGRLRSEREVLAAYAHVAPRIARDIASLSARPGARRPNPHDRRFDHLSIAEYLRTLELEPWLRNLIEVAYVTEYGLDAGEQSALNLLTLIGTDTSHGFAILGSSDERYKIRAGSARLTDALAAHLTERIFLGHRLVRLRRDASAWVLSLARAGGTVEVRADAVVLALPFTLLREVELDGAELPPLTRRAIETLGYGTNSKLLLGTRRPVWRDRGFDGGVYTDLAFQSGWDCSRLRGGGDGDGDDGDGNGGVYTYFLGGREGLVVGQGGAPADARRYARLTDAVFSGFTEQWTGEARVVHWPSQPFARGSYTCYRPGQWTTIGGAARATVHGSLYFAGEHCATDSQGYMNGAAETGRRAALAILRRAARS